MKIEIFHNLPEDARMIRLSVFVAEQGFIREFDDDDRSAIHLVGYEGGVPVATCRICKQGQENTYLIGRIAVLKAHRGRGFGAAIVDRATDVIRRSGGRKILIHAQARAKEFYRKQGFLDCGIGDTEEGCPHIWMYRDL